MWDSLLLLRSHEYFVSVVFWVRIFIQTKPGSKKKKKKREEKTKTHEQKTRTPRSLINAPTRPKKHPQNERKHKKQNKGQLFLVDRQIVCIPLDPGFDSSLTKKKRYTLKHTFQRSCLFFSSLTTFELNWPVGARTSVLRTCELFYVMTLPFFP